MHLIQSLKVWWLSLPPVSQVKSAGSRKRGREDDGADSLDNRVHSMYSDFCLKNICNMYLLSQDFFSCRKKSKCHSDVKVEKKKNYRLNKTPTSGEAGVHLSWFRHLDCFSIIPGMIQVSSSLLSPSPLLLPAPDALLCDAAEQCPAGLILCAI